MEYNLKENYVKKPFGEKGEFLLFLPGAVVMGKASIEKNYPVIKENDAIILSIIAVEEFCNKIEDTISPAVLSRTDFKIKLSASKEIKGNLICHGTFRDNYYITTFCYEAMPSCTVQFIAEEIMEFYLALRVGLPSCVFFTVMQVEFINKFVNNVMDHKTSNFINVIEEWKDGQNMQLLYNIVKKTLSTMDMVVDIDHYCEIVLVEIEFLSALYELKKVSD